ncbi:MAG: DUF4886 domain-containing protein [Candidatus Cryptobacteroides sp.]
MKRVFCLAVILIASFCASSAQESLGGPSLPQNPDTLRILAVGNSFSDDGTEYLPNLLEAAGIHNVIVARLYIGGCSLERHCNEYYGNLNQYRYSKSGPENKWEVEKEQTLVHGLKDEPWDIITIQQASGFSGEYESISRWLPELVSIIRKECTNPEATIVWHQTWSYARNSTHNDFPKYGNDQERMTAAIQECVDRLCEDFGIHTVIPTGVAVGIARNNRRLNTAGKVPRTCRLYDLTRDGFHLSYQHGRYLAACIWFEALIKPTLGISVKGNRSRILDTDYSIPERDARICRRIAAKAVRKQGKK